MVEVTRRRRQLKSVVGGEKDPTTEFRNGEFGVARGDRSSTRARSPWGRRALIRGEWTSGLRRSFLGRGIPADA
jgi:hypothetical protein